LPKLPVTLAVACNLDARTNAAPNFLLFTKYVNAGLENGFYILYTPIEGSHMCSVVGGVR